MHDQYTTIENLEKLPHRVDSGVVGFNGLIGVGAEILNPNMGSSNGCSAGICDYNGDSGVRHLSEGKMARYEQA